MPNDKTTALVERLLVDADEIEACGGGNEARIMREVADEITRLRAALHPFAKAADMYPDMADNVAILGSLVGTMITFGDLRRARDVCQGDGT